MSIFSGSYCEIVTPLTDNRLNFTSDAMSQVVSDWIHVGDQPRWKHSFQPVSWIRSISKTQQTDQRAIEQERKDNLHPFFGWNGSQKLVCFHERRKKSQREHRSPRPSKWKKNRGAMRRSLHKSFLRSNVANSEVLSRNWSIESRGSRIKSTSPNTSPFQKSLHHHIESLHQSYSKTPSGKGFLSNVQKSSAEPQLVSKLKMMAKQYKKLCFNENGDIDQDLCERVTECILCMTRVCHPHQMAVR